MSAALELIDLAGQRGERTLFRDVRQRVEARQLLRVRGANGAGKTTLLRMVCGLLEPVAGEVRWHGRNVARMRDLFHRDLVYVGHAAALKDDLSATENLLAASTLAGHAAQPRDAAYALQLAGLQGRERRPARQLSQGQRRRVALARLVLSTAAPLWVLDEPFNALDADAAAWLAGVITKQLDRGGVVVLTSHQGVPLDDAPQQVTLAL